MGKKHVRNHIPALSDAVKNLLAVHSLDAWPVTLGWHHGARKTGWRVIKCGQDHIKSKPLFTVFGQPSLEHWINRVKLYEESKTLPGTVDWSLPSRIWYADETTHIYFETWSRVP